MTETADVVSGVSVIKRVTPVRRRQTELPAVVDGPHILKDGIDRFQDAAVELLEFAQFDWIVDAVVLHVVGILRRFERARASHGVTVHVGQTAVARYLIVIDGPVIAMTAKHIYLDQL